MLFNSLGFMIFMPLVFALYWLLPHKCRWFLLLVASYYFYMSWNPKYIVLILSATLVSYLAGLGLERTASPGKRKLIVGASFTVSLGLLFFFKYFNFFSDSVVQLLSLFAIRLHPVTLRVLLPVGISFYTFQTMSYVIDVYRGKVCAEHHFGIYATFISFFPQLVAGPIERTENLLPQINSVKTFRYDQAAYGLKLMAWGFFKKLAIADILGPIADQVYANLPGSSTLDILLAVFCFAIQIYCDFSGYSDIAIGAAKLLGIDLMTNFRSPYFSRSIREFWSRWHISLSTWFRDYVYIPLGGSRCGAWKASRNLMITFLVSGLWHGASWTFVVWGGLHGLAQAIERLLGLHKPGKRLGVLRCLGVFLFCCVGWVFFRAERFSDAFYVLSALLRGVAGQGSWQFRVVDASMLTLFQGAIAVAVLGIFDFFSLKTDVIAWISRQNVIIRWAMYLGLVWLILFFMPVIGNSEFVYFQF